MYKTIVPDNENRSHLLTVAENLFAAVLFNRLMHLSRFILYHFYNVCVHNLYFFSLSRNPDSNRGPIHYE